MTRVAAAGRSKAAAACALALIVALATGSAGCARRPGIAPTPKPTIALRNPIDFPLYPQSRLVGMKNFSFTTPEQAYAGVEVIAASSATFVQLRSWLARQYQHPPVGYFVQTADFGRTSMPEGIAFGAFQSRKKPAPLTVFVIVMDPPAVNRTLGPALGLLALYRRLPAGMRSGFDERFKKQTGFTIDEATAPDKPLGIALAAMADLQHSNDRALVLVGAHKK